MYFISNINLIINLDTLFIQSTKYICINLGQLFLKAFYILKGGKNLKRKKESSSFAKDLFI